MKTKLRGIKFATVLLLVALVFSAAWAVLATSGNEAAVDGTEYATLQEAIDAAEDGAVVTLLRDVSTDVYLTIVNKSLTIDGQCMYTVTGSAKKTFEIKNTEDRLIEVNFVGVTIVNTYSGSAHEGRCIDTRNDYINLYIGESTLYATNPTVSQPITIGGSDTAYTNQVSIANSELYARGESDSSLFGYALIVWVPADVTIYNSYAECWSLAYFRDLAADSQLSVMNCEVKSVNNIAGATNAFGAIVTSVDNVNVSVMDTAFALYSTDEVNAAQSLVTVTSTGANTYVKIEGDTTVVGAVPGLLVINSSDATNTIEIVDGKFDVPVAPEYIADGVPSYTEPDGTVVIGKNVQIEDEYYATLQQAIDEAADGATITLLRDVYTDVYLTIVNKSLTIDGQGAYMVIGSAKKTFEIKNTENNPIEVRFEGIGIANLYSGSAHEGRCIDTRNDYIDLYINESEIFAINPTVSQPITIGGSDTEYINRVVVTNSEIYARGASEYSLYGYAIIVWVPTDVILDGCYVESWSLAYFRDLAADSSLYVTDCEVASVNNNVGETNAFGAIVTSVENVAMYVCDTEFYLSSADEVHAPQALIVIADTGANTYAEIYGDTSVVGAIPGILVIDNSEEEDQITISDGTFDVPVASEYLAEGIYTFTDEDGITHVDVPAEEIESAAGVQVGNAFFATIDEAISSAQDGDVLLLKKDTVIETSIVVAQGTVTLDLNGQSLYIKGGAVSTFALRNTPTYAFVVGEGSTLDLTGQGFVYVEGNGYLVDGGTVTVSDGVTFISVGTLFTVNAGSLEINGGEFNINGTAIYVPENATADVVVNAGYFYLEEGDFFVGSGITVNSGFFSDEVDLSYIPQGHVQMEEPYNGGYVIMSEADYVVFFDVTYRKAAQQAAIQDAQSWAENNIYSDEALNYISNVLSDTLNTMEMATTFEELNSALVVADSYYRMVLTYFEKETVVSEISIDIMQYLNSKGLAIQDLPDSLLDSLSDMIGAAVTRAELLTIAESMMWAIDEIALAYTIEDAVVEANAYANKLGFTADVTAINAATTERAVAKALAESKAAVDAELEAYKQAAITGLFGTNSENAAHVTTAMVAGIQTATSKAAVDSATAIANAEIAEIKAQKEALDALGTKVEQLGTSITDLQDRVEDAANNAQTAATNAANAAQKAETAGVNALAAKNAAEAATQAANDAKAAAQTAKSAVEAAKIAAEAANVTANELKALIAAAEAATKNAQTAAKAAETAAKNAELTASATKTLVESALAVDENAEEAAEKETEKVLAVMIFAEALVLIVCIVAIVLVYKKRNGKQTPPAAEPAPTAEPEVTEEIAPVAEPVEEAPAPVAEEEPMAEEAVAEAQEEAEAPVAETDAEESDEEDEDDSDDDDSDADETTVDPFGALKGKTAKSFAERLAEADAQMVQNYESIRDEFLSYKRVTVRISQKCASFRLGRELLAKVLLRGKSVNCYFALDPETLSENVFHHKDMHEKKAYEQVPTLLRVRSPRAAKNAIRLIAEIATKNEMVKK